MATSQMGMMVTNQFTTVTGSMAQMSKKLSGSDARNASHPPTAWSANGMAKKTRPTRRTIHWTVSV